MATVLVFDLDDTLWDLAPVLVAAEQAVHRWLEQNAPEVSDHFGVQGLRGLKDQLHNQYPELTHQISQLRIVAMEHAMREVGYSAERAAEQARLAFEVFIQARHEVTFFESAESILRELSQHYTLGVLTNGNADVRRLGIDHYFDFALSAEQLNSSKPAPEPFLAVLEVSGARANQVIHVGDHPQHDILGARAAGMQTIWANIQQLPWRGDGEPGPTITHLEQLPATIEQIAQRVV